MLLMCTNTACSTDAEWQILSEALTSEVGLLQNFHAFNWIPLSMEKKLFLRKESDTKILQSMFFAYVVCIISSYSNRIHILNESRCHLIFERLIYVCSC